MSTNRIVRVIARAAGVPGPEIFSVETAPMPDCPAGGVVVRVLNASVDPAMRGWLSAEKNYLTVPDGSVMRAHGVAQVIASDCPQWEGGRWRSAGSACVDGIDLFFDNTAGAIADAVFPHLKVGARVIQCGTASVATWLPPPIGPRREREVLVKPLSWFGFVASDHVALFPQALAELQAPYRAGGLTSHDEVLDGLEQARGAIARLYRGENKGRLSLRP